MNKIVFVIIGFVILALAGGAYLASDSDDTDQASTITQQTESDSQAQQTGDSEEEEEITLPTSGTNSILDYSPEALATSETENNLLFFHAKWCTVCNAVERNLEAGSIPDDLSIFKVDYDSDVGQSLADQYKIPIQYSMVQVSTEGEEITQWVNNFSDGVDEVTSNLL